MGKIKIFVFARLKPSQIDYKIIPLSKSALVERVFVLRKTPLIVNSIKVECIALPKILRLRIFYWLFTSIYGAWVIKKNGADLIVSYNIFPHGFNGFFASLLTKKPFVFAEINEDTLYYYKNPIFRTIIKKILHRANYITVPGSRTEERWRFYGYEKIIKLHSTINTDVFCPAVKEKNIDFLFIGEFDKNKRPDLILDVFTEIRSKGFDISICFIGFGKLNKLLESEIKRRRLNNYAQIVKTSNVLEYLSNSKILVMASLSEGLPCVLLEAMACELVVVIPPVGDITDVVKHGVNGFLHDNSKEGIGNGMLEAYKNFDKLGNLRKRARETIIHEHSYQVAEKKWNDLLSKIQTK